MKTLTLLAIAFLSSSTSFADPVIQEFHILHGTGNGAWNTEATTVQAEVGQVLRVYNDDTIVHRLHTNGVPCEHGPTIAVGKTWDCVLSAPYHAATNGPLYDHNVGPAARFYLDVK